MKININLSLGLPAEQRLKLPSAFALRILSAYTVVLMIIWLMVWISGVYQQSVLTKAIHKQMLVSQQLTEIEAKYAVSSKLSERVRSLTALIERQRQRYSRYLNDLATQVPQGIWLENFEFSQEGSYIKLTGKTFHSPLAMVLLQNLSTAPSFADKKFKIFDLSVEFPKNTAAYSAQKLASFTLQTE